MLHGRTGTVAAAGISQLQHVDLNSSRNLFIVGLSLMFGMALPLWLREHPHAIDSGKSQTICGMCCVPLSFIGLIRFLLCLIFSGITSNMSGFAAPF